MTQSIERATVSAGSGIAPEEVRRRRDFAFERLSGLYVLILMIIAFSVWLPDTFRTVNNARVIAASAAITGILTIGLIVSLISGVFDISVGANMSFAISFVGWLQATANLNAVLAVVLTLLSGAAIGMINAVIVTRLNVDPVIGTLGMSSVLAALAYWVAGGKTILYGISSTFTSFGTSKILTIPVPVFYLAGVALGVWYLLEHTPAGRYFYAIGANANAARLAGLNVVRLQWSALILSGTLAAFAGVVLTMQLGAASFGAGSPYLLPAFAAAFLGSTQIKPGRFNVAGTLIALYLLAVGVKGLQLRWPGLPWIKNLFEGLILIIAVALGRYSAKRRAGEGIVAAVPMTMNVAVIGLGEMGGAIAANLAAKGHDVGVFDLDQGRLDEAVRRGCRAAPSAADAAADAQIVHVVVFTDDQARAVVVGDRGYRGILAAMSPGTVLVIHSTIAPQTCRDLGSAADSHGVRVIDAGMTGAGAAARSGTMALLVGGDAATVEACRDELSCVAGTIIHVGPLGSGMVGKIVNNISVLANAEVLRQLLALATAAGLAESAALEILDAGSGRSWVSEHWALVRSTVESPTDGTTYAAMARKDSALAVELAAHSGAVVPIVAVVSRRLAELDAAAEH